MRFEIRSRRIEMPRVRLMMMASFAALALGLGCTAEAAPAKTPLAAPAPIVVKPQVSIAGVRLGDSEEAVEGRIGPPVRIGPDTQAGPVVYEQWFYPGLKVGLVGTPDRLSVLNIETRARTAKTPRGVGVGSSETKVRRAYPPLRCSTYRKVRTCALGEPGSRQTGFTIRRGRVSAIWIADVF